MITLIILIILIIVARLWQERNAIWTLKLLNVALMAGAIELFIVVREPRRGNNGGKKDEPQRGAGQDEVPIALARIDTLVFTKVMLRDKPLLHTEHADTLTAPVASILKQLDAKEAVNVVAWALDASARLLLVVDLRKMVRKKKAAAPLLTTGGSPRPSSGGGEPDEVHLLSSVLPRKAMWENGHRAFFFFEGKPRLQFVIPTQLGTKGAAFMLMSTSASVEMMQARILPCLPTAALLATAEEDAEFATDE